MIYFATPIFLLGVVVAPLFLIFAWLWQCRIAQRLQRFSRHAKPFPKHSRMQLVLVSFALFFLAVACARPHWGRSAETMTMKLRNVIVAVDVSRSMLAQDIRPSRLEYVKADIVELIDALQDDSMGIIAFKGVGELICPLTTDKSYLHDCVKRLTTDLLPPGETNLAGAIDTALQSFAVAQTTHNVLLLISDGEQLSGEAYAAADRAKEANVPIFTIGVGDARGTALVVDGQPVKWEGKPVMSALDETALKEIANRSRGRYIPLATSHLSKTSLVTIYQRYLSQLDAQMVEEQRERAFTERTWIFVLMSVFCLFAAAVLSLGRIPLARRKAFVAVVVLFSVSLAFGVTHERQAQAAYQAGAFQAAIEGYDKALSDPSLSSDERAQYAYNKALAHWKKGELERALKTLSIAMESPRYHAEATALEALLYYQMEEAPAPVVAEGENQTKKTEAQDRLEKRRETIAAYTRALQVDPTNTVAKENLARVAKDLPQMEYDARKERLVEAYQSQSIAQIATTLKDEQRALINQVPARQDGESIADYLQRTAAFADRLKAQSDRCFYMTECAQPQLEQLFFPPTEEALSEEDKKQRQQAISAILNYSKQAEASLQQLSDRYRALATEPEPLLQDEAIAHGIWNTIATPESRLDEAIQLQKHINANEQPLYYKQRDIRAEKTQQAKLVTAAVDTLLEQPPVEGQPSLSEEDKERLKQLNTSLKSQLELPETKENNEQTLQTMTAMREILAKLQPPQQQDQQSQDQQSQNQQQNQQQSQEQQSQEQNQQEQQASEEETKEQPSAADEQQQMSEEERKAAQEREKEAEEKLKEMLKQQEIEAILQKAEERAEELEEAKRQYLNQRANRLLKDW